MAVNAKIRSVVFIRHIVFGLKFVLIHKAPFYTYNMYSQANNLHALNIGI